METFVEPEDIAAQKSEFLSATTLAKSSAQAFLDVTEHSKPVEEYDPMEAYDIERAIALSLAEY